MAIAGIKRGVLVFFCVLALAVLAGLRPSRADESALVEKKRAPKQPVHDGFPHEQKEHRKVECVTCHLGAKEKPVASDQPMAKDFPHESCIRCHNFAQEFFKVAMGGASQFCSICHETRRISAKDKALRTGNIASKNSQFDDLFGHEGHRLRVPDYVHIRPVASGPEAGYGKQFRAGVSPTCTACHAPLMRVAASAKDMRTEKSHAACFVCHSGELGQARAVKAEKFPYESDCAICHALVEKGPATSRDYTLFGSVKKFRHDDHDIDIRPKKRSDLPLPTAPDFLCVQCHAPIEKTKALAEIKLPQAEYCNQCHKTRKPGLPDKLSDEASSKLGKRP